MRIYGLTGGTGSGKSEAVRRFAELGIPVIDADKIGHQLHEPGGAAVERVIQAFGVDVLTDGAVDRAKLGRIVFDDAAARKQLGVIIHPMIAGVIAERCGALLEQGRNTVIIDAALLAEGGKREPWLTGLILVTCREDMRLARLVQSRGMDPEQARQRIAAQTPPETKIPLADWVIVNEGTLDQLRDRVDQVAELIKRKDADT